MRAQAAHPLPPSLPPLGLSRVEAAAYIGVSPSMFDLMVKDGRMPGPKRIGDLRLWDRARIDQITGWVYVMEFEGYVKIGWSRNVAGRHSAIQDGLPEELRFLWCTPGTQARERALHRRFDAYRTRGEWFRHEGELAEWIKEGCPL